MPAGKAKQGPVLGNACQAPLHAPCVMREEELGEEEGVEEEEEEDNAKWHEQEDIQEEGGLHRQGNRTPNGLPAIQEESRQNAGKSPYVYVTLFVHVTSSSSFSLLRSLLRWIARALKAAPYPSRHRDE